MPAGLVQTLLWGWGEQRYVNTYAVEQGKVQCEIRSEAPG